ncbi:hypothetical protein [Azospirillum rugosum]|uniref:Hemolysin-type calcium-binding repeat-containing protein n=1 Tax=Azospirillum rugosum TaxID=416170 RepID=A0ABS4SR39_9PROT|nr:hypothetical protein [Azospirillum rugosum]MBP2294912.1 hypothetical protein [Azospirillum rugosum]MDQ0528166.1 hypothetical protein [Azospirillum rugosum]
MPASPIGTEFLVNATTSGDQSAPAVAPLAGGGFVVTWVDGSRSADDSSGTAVRGQLYDARGAKTGAEFLVNTTTAGSQESPVVAGLAGGGFVVTWIVNAAVYGQRFAADGTKLGAEFFIGGNGPLTTIILGDGKARFLNYNSEGPYASAPDVMALPGGGFAVTWSSITLGAGGIVGQAFDATGAKVGAGFGLLIDAGGVQVSPDVTIAKLVTLDDKANLLLTNRTSGWSDVTPLAGGGFLTVWTTAGKVGSAAGDTDIHGQLFDAAGNLVGSDILVNSTTAGAQSRPTVAALPSGGFIVAWTDVSQTGADGSGSAVRAQTFSAAGKKVGLEFLVNTTTATAQASPSLAVLPDGTVVAAWADGSGSGADTSGSAVRAQLFTVAPTDPARRLLVKDGSGDREVQMDRYAGPLPWLRNQYVGQSGGEAAVGSDEADFLNLQAGDDAAEGKGGNDVLDGGNGSNFLTGGGGTDTFFVDGRVAGTTWSTVTDFGQGEWVTAWGWTPGTSTVTWADMQGAEGYKGTTAHIDTDGNGAIDLSITFTGKTAGSVLATPGQSGADRYLAFTLG